MADDDEDQDDLENLDDQGEDMGEPDGDDNPDDEDEKVGPDDGAPDDKILSDASMGALPVRLDFDIGHVELSYAELSALSPGQSFDLGRPADESVAIRVAGRKVGVGELIEVNGRIGVRIRTLAK